MKIDTGDGFVEAYEYCSGTSLGPSQFVEYPLLFREPLPGQEFHQFFYNRCHSRDRGDEKLVHVVTEEGTPPVHHVKGYFMSQRVEGSLNGGCLVELVERVPESERFILTARVQMELGVHDPVVFD